MHSDFRRVQRLKFNRSIEELSYIHGVNGSYSPLRSTTVKKNVVDWNLIYLYAKHNFHVSRARSTGARRSAPKYLNLDASPPSAKL